MVAKEAVVMRLSRVVTACAAAALLACAAAGIVVGHAATHSLAGQGPPARASHGPAIASRAEVAAFLARAERGFAGRLLLRYAVWYTTGPQAARGSVVVAQLSPARWAYFSSPGVTAIHATGTSSAVVMNPAGEPSGWYACQRPAAASPWSCADLSAAAMGTRAELLGPYPPQALILGLQNAIAIPIGQPAYLVIRNAGSRTSSCLTFGRPASPVALVCLNQAGVMTSYQIPIDGSYYVKAELQSYSTTVPGTLLALPARPRLP
jgi:hypothetical protein